jgi:hypothetical protein
MEAEQPENVPIFDYPVLSDDRVEAGTSLADAQPGERVLCDETVYVFVDDWQKGEVIGSVTIEETPTTRPGKTLFTATFDFGGDDVVVVSGFVPGSGSWVGTGKAGAEGKTGKFKGRRGEVPIEGRNPKSWG